MDETERKGIVVANERAYHVPIDVAVSHGRLERLRTSTIAIIHEALAYLDQNAPGKAREVLIEALQTTQTTTKGQL